MKTLDESVEIKHENLKLGALLGKGGFGEVYLAKWQHTRVYEEDVAVKLLPMDKLNDAALAAFIDEAAIHVELNHPNIVKMCGVTLKPPYYMVMKIMANGSLYDYLHSVPPEAVQWNRRFTIGHDIASGIAYLHGSRHLVHGDLKSLNILLDGKVAKIGDFGLSKARSASFADDLAGDCQGSFLWMAPELFSVPAVKTFESDIFAFGWILSEIATHKTPYQDDYDKPLEVIKSYIKRGLCGELPASTPHDYQALVNDCRTKAAEERPTAELVLKAISALVDTHANPIPQAFVRPSAPLITSSLRPSVTSGPAYVLESRSKTTNRQSALIAAQNKVKLFSSSQPAPSAPTVTQMVSQAKPLIAQEVNWRDYNLRMPGAKHYFDGEAFLLKNQLLESLPHFIQAARSGYQPANVLVAYVNDKLLQGNKLKQSVEWLKTLAEKEMWMIRITASIPWYQQEANNGNPIAHYVLGIINSFGFGIDDENPRLGLTHMQCAAERGYVLAQFFLAMLYHEGIIIKTEWNSIFLWVYRAAAQGHVEAQYYSGYCFELGKGTEIDFKNALHFYNSAAGSGNAKAAHRLGEVCELGLLGVNPNSSHAVGWYQLAMSLDHSPAMFKLGWAYESGKLGLKPDVMKMAEMYHKAAMLGHAAAQLAYGVCCEQGRGTRRSDHKALIWYRKAAAQGEDVPRIQANKLRRQLRDNLNGNLPVEIVNDLECADIALAMAWASIVVFELPNLDNGNVIIRQLRAFISKGISVKYLYEAKDTLKAQSRKFSPTIAAEIDLLTELN
ncbi:MAG: Sel1-like repeat-containing protein kinase family protein, partial [Pseudomonadota bacterium]|nr:Sel1-like repeat-containing protein kinase family protein [Pseudomonadota bacterium]